MKPCSRCRLEKPSTTEFFSPLKKAKDGLHSWCKACLASWRRDDRAKNPDRYSAIEKARYQRSGEFRRERNRAVWAVKGEAYRARSKARAEIMRPVYVAERRRKYAESPELRRKASVANREWRVKNAEKISASLKQAWRNAPKREKLRTYFGAAISHSLKGRKKGGRGWQEILGYTKEELVAHLEKQFLRGMNWNNYGEWHVDHIRPVRSFSYESVADPDFMACWSLPNLRPMWAGDNIRKRDKIVSLL